MLGRRSDMSSSSLARVRLLAVSATIPNVEDLGKIDLEYMNPLCFKATTNLIFFTPFTFEIQLNGSRFLHKESKGNFLSSIITTHRKIYRYRNIHVYVNIGETLGH